MKSYENPMGDESSLQRVGTMSSKHELLKQEKDKLTSVHFYVDFHAGDDANNGTAADRPWRTLGRANFEVRLRRERAGDAASLAPTDSPTHSPACARRCAAGHYLIGAASSGRASDGRSFETFMPDAHGSIGAAGAVPAREQPRVPSRW